MVFRLLHKIYLLLLPKPSCGDTERIQSRGRSLHQLMKIILG